MFRRQIVLPHIVKRFKKTKASVYAEPREKTKKTSIDRALDHFDDFYKSVFGPRWGGMRASLLTEHKYAALVNNFGDADETKQSIELSGAVNIRHIFEIFHREQEEATEPDQISQSSSIDQKLSEIVHSKQTTEIRALYKEHADESIERIRNERDNTRVIDAEDIVSYKKSLKQSLDEDVEYDFNRMVSSEIGVMGLQEFIPATKLKGMEDFVPESQHYQYYSTTVDFPLTIEPETNFEFPKTLDIYAFPKGDISRFSRPRRGLTKTFSHFLLDGASILPPLMLNVQPDELVLDACSAPGGKSLILLQSALPRQVVCNDRYGSRTNRIYKLFDQYLPDFRKQWEGNRCIINTADIRDVVDYAKYDKILLDVPCSNDRLSVTENENSMFKGDRIKERLQLPELQASLLVHCLQLLRPGGSLVYSTCSLSPVQNDGVVNMALSRAFTEFHITTTIKDLTHVLRPFRKIFHFEDPKQLKFGQLVLPQLPANFGPMYFCKITRNET